MYAQLQKHPLRNSILLFALPLIIYGSIALIQFVMRFTGSPEIIRIAINIFSIVEGIAGLVFIIVGPVLGIKLLIDNAKNN